MKDLLNRPTPNARENSIDRTVEGERREAYPLAIGRGRDDGGDGHRLDHGSGLELCVGSIPTSERAALVGVALFCICEARPWITEEESTRNHVIITHVTDEKHNTQFEGWRSATNLQLAGCSVPGGPRSSRPVVPIQSEKSYIYSELGTQCSTEKIRAEIDSRVPCIPGRSGGPGWCRCRARWAAPSR